jgi:hypothetical protein
LFRGGLNVKPLQAKTARIAPLRKQSIRDFVHGKTVKSRRRRATVRREKIPRAPLLHFSEREGRAEQFR